MLTTVLKDLLKRDPSLLQSSGRLQGLLLDKYPGDLVRVRLLILAMKSDIHNALLVLKKEPDAELHLPRLAKKLQAEWATEEKAARETVQLWAEALGVLLDPAEKAFLALEKKLKSSAWTPEVRLAEWKHFQATWPTFDRQDALQKHIHHCEEEIEWNTLHARLPRLSPAQRIKKCNEYIKKHPNSPVLLQAMEQLKLSQAEDEYESLLGLENKKGLSTDTLLKKWDEFIQKWHLLPHTLRDARERRRELQARKEWESLQEEAGRKQWKAGERVSRAAQFLSAHPNTRAAKQAEEWLRLGRCQADLEALPPLDGKQPPTSPDLTAWRLFVERYPDTQEAAEARNALLRLCEKEFYEAKQASANATATEALEYWTRFLLRWPEEKQADSARQHYENAQLRVEFEALPPLDTDVAGPPPSLKAWFQFIGKYPHTDGGHLADDLLIKRRDQEFEQTRTLASTLSGKEEAALWRQFLERWPPLYRSQKATQALKEAEHRAEWEALPPLSGRETPSANEINTWYLFLEKHKNTPWEEEAETALEACRDANFAALKSDAPSPADNPEGHIQAWTAFLERWPQVSPEQQRFADQRIEQAKAHASLESLRKHTETLSHRNLRNAIARYEDFLRKHATLECAPAARGQYQQLLVRFRRGERRKLHFLFAGLLIFALCYPWIVRTVRNHVERRIAVSLEPRDDISLGVKAQAWRSLMSRYSPGKAPGPIQKQAAYWGGQYDRLNTLYSNARSMDQSTTASLELKIKKWGEFLSSFPQSRETKEVRQRILLLRAELVFEQLVRIETTDLSDVNKLYALWYNYLTHHKTANYRLDEAMARLDRYRPTFGFVRTLDLGGGVTMNLVYIRGGTFLMGSPQNELDRFLDEDPQTHVTLTDDFWMGETEVTQAQWKAVMGSGNNPSKWKGDNLPVENVSWKDAMEFCRKLSEKVAQAAPPASSPLSFTLPTEAQWEYACRAGTTSRFSFGDSDSWLGDYAWYKENSGSKTHPVKTKKPNAWGLYDMHGNVWEWCLDWYADKLPGGSVTNPTGPSASSVRVNRGGGWNNLHRACWSAYRNSNSVRFRINSLGFRTMALVFNKSKTTTTVAAAWTPFTETPPPPPKPDYAKKSDNGRFLVYSKGVILDKKTNLEWIIGPNRDFTYGNAIKWVFSCRVAGPGWRMPMRKELLELCQDRNSIDPIFIRTGSWVWAEPKDESSAWRVRILIGHEDWDFHTHSFDGRVFGVRSRR